MKDPHLRLAKFWSRVKIPGHRFWLDHCWEWRGSITTDRPGNEAGGWGGGYGCLTVDGVWWRAHRYIWTLLFGDIPEDKVIGHTCDNRACVNPRHLELVTLSENLQHAHDRGRRNGDECPF